jgi:hypothetical protein
MVSSKERSAKHRQKLSQDKKDAIKAKDKLRKQLARSRLTDARLQHDREEARHRMWKLRDKRRREALKNSGDNTEKNASPQVILSPFGSRQAQGKAVRRVQFSLPKSPRKQKFVVEHLAKRCGVRLDTNEGFSKAGSNKLSDEVQQAVKDFYMRDDISRQAPGRKDYITIKTGKEKGKVQKRHLYVTVAEVHQLFITEFPNLKIGLSSMARLRPAHVRLSSETPTNVCVCQKHANVKLLLEKLPTLPSSCRELVNLCVCNSSNKGCMMGECTTCSDLLLFKKVTETISDDLLQQDLTWSKWCQDENGKTVRILQEGSVQDALIQLQTLLPEFLVHVYINMKQSAYFVNAYTNVTAGNAVLQVDFSENYALAYQDEVQSAHWNAQQVALYTAVAWMFEKTVSYVIVTDHMQHDKYAVDAFNAVIIKDMKENQSDLKKVQNSLTFVTLSNVL